MRALRYYGPGDVRLDNIPEPPAGDKQIKIKVAWTGICGSDLHAWHIILPLAPTATNPHPVTGETLPIGLGHEMSGTIVKIGPGVDSTKFRVGQKVCVEPLLSCGKSTCSSCSQGMRNLCRHTTFIGLGGGGGGMSEYVSVADNLVYPLPDDMSLEAGALMEPLAVSWHAAKRAHLKAGDHVLIMGSGPIGLLTLAVAKVFGAAWVGIVEPTIKRRELAKALGADAIYDPTTPNIDIPALVRELTNDRGVDVVFDAAGVQPTMDIALLAVRPRGNICNIAGWAVKPILNMDALMYKEVSLTGILAYDRVHAELLEAVNAGKFKDFHLEQIVTRRIPLEDFVEKGINSLTYEKDTHVKILVTPVAGAGDA